MARLLSVAGLLLLSPLALASEGADPWTFGVKLSVSALLIGGVAAILGLWVGRDQRRPATFALAMSGLIGSAIGVGAVQSYLDSVDGLAKEADLERMMTMVAEIAVASGDTELAALIEAEGGPKLEIEAEPEPADDELTEAAPAVPEIEE